MDCKMGASRRKAVYFKQLLLIINLPGKHWGSGDPWKKVTARFVGLQGQKFEEILQYLCAKRRLNGLKDTG